MNGKGIWLFTVPQTIRSYETVWWLDIFFTVLQYGWKMLQSLKSKVVKDLNSQRFSIIKILSCTTCTHKCTQKHTHTQHVSGHLTAIITTDHILNGLREKVIWESMAGKVIIWKIPKAHGRVILSSTGSLRFGSSNLTTSLFPVFISCEYINEHLVSGTPLSELGTYAFPAWPT